MKTCSFFSVDEDGRTLPGDLNTGSSAVMPFDERGEDEEWREWGDAMDSGTVAAFSTGVSGDKIFLFAVLGSDLKEAVADNAEVKNSGVVLDFDLLDDGAGVGVVGVSVKFDDADIIAVLEVGPRWRSIAYVATQN